MPYMGVQLVGAFTGALLVFGIFHDALEHFELQSGLVRGEAGSEASAMVFGEFFPNPGGEPLTEVTRGRMSALTAFGAEVLGTAVLLLVICGLVDERNPARPRVWTAAAIGLTVTLLISLLGPLTMACFNPARDLGPRLFSTLAGWGSLPFRVNGMGWLTIYIIAPFLGGLLGGAIYHYCFRGAYAGEAQRAEG
jgi:glycerol uptake facilitator protein